MHTASSWSFGPFEFNARTFRLRRGTDVVPLEPKAMDVLRLLLERSPDVVEKSEIFETVWRDVAVTDNALTRVIAQLRRALDDDAKRPRYIETVATRGYRMMADVRLTAVGAVDTAVATAPTSGVAGPTAEAGEAPAAIAEPSSASSSAAVPAAVAERPPSLRWTPRNLALLAAGLTLMVFVGLVIRPLASKLVSKVGFQAAPGVAVDSGFERTARLWPVQMTTGAGLDAQPAFSRDGSTLAFSSDRSGSFEIYVQSLAAGALPTALTSNGRVNLQPTWSADGRFIAYHQAQDGGIWLVPSRGGTGRRLVDVGSNPAWSPDGRLIAYQTFNSVLIPTMTLPTGPSSVRVVDVSSGTWKPIGTGRTNSGPLVTPRWSHDGRRLYFMEAPQPYTDKDTTPVTLWSVDVASGEARIEAQSPLMLPDYALAKDGTGAWLTAPTGAVWWLPLSGDVPQRRPQPTGLPLAGVPGELTMSPDGGLLSWSARLTTTQLWSVALPSRDGRTATPEPVALGSGVRVTGAVAAPDGRLAYAGVLRGSQPQVWLRGIDGATRQITLDDGTHNNPVWLTGGSEVAHFSEHGGVQSMNATNVETGAERVLFGLADLPIPSGSTLHRLPGLNLSLDRTATHVVMALETNGIMNLWVSNREASGRISPPRQVTHEKQGGSFPHWSPDGRFVSYQCDEGDDTHVCVVANDGSGQRQLTHEPGQSFIGGWIESDQILVAARRNAVWNVIGVDHQTGRITRYTDYTDARSYARYPQWEPIGRRVTFERAEATGNVWFAKLP